jgi:hypothetical protein
MKEEISGLDKGHGYLKCGNLVVRFSFPYLEPAHRHPDFLEREMPPFPAHGLRNSGPESSPDAREQPRGPQPSNGTAPRSEQDSGQKQESAGFIK